MFTHKLHKLFIELRNLQQPHIKTHTKHKPK